MGMSDDVWQPEVGDRAHYVPYTDRYPCTVVEVSPSGHQITLREDRATCTDPDLQPGGFAPVHGPRQRWECHEDPAGRTFKATRRKNGRYKRVGFRTRSPGGHVRPGWSKYRDPHY